MVGKLRNIHLEPKLFPKFGNINQKLPTKFLSAENYCKFDYKKRVNTYSKTSHIIPPNSKKFLIHHFLSWITLLWETDKIAAPFLYIMLFLIKMHKNHYFLLKFVSGIPKISRLAYPVLLNFHIHITFSFRVWLPTPENESSKLISSGIRNGSFNKSAVLELYVHTEI